MRIKSLQVHGFKSFVDKTVFDFRDGITAVVGPNGCGKSNVVDAMRWAMGEQSPRRLRGKGMDDVIFAGAEGRAPVGMAEVVITFDNRDGEAPAAFKDYAEIQVARRIYRTGESEYLLNGTSVRLRDVLDFFRDTGIGTKGYTIVEQGKIAEIVSAKPDERRQLIEEAAGISKYKARRAEAERKIASTEQNLVRVTDVLAEIRRQISSIERQARKAARYKRLRESVRVLELSLAADERRDLVAEIERAAERRSRLHDEATGLETRVAERDLALEETRIALAEAERALNLGSEALYALRGEIKELEGRIEFGQRERESLAEGNRGRAEELDGLRERLRTGEDDAGRVEQELARLEEGLAAESEGIAAAEARAREATEALHGLERERDAANAALVEVLTRLARAEDRLAALEDRRAQLDQRLRSADEELAVQQTEAARAEGQQHDLEEGLRNLLGERDQLQERLLLALKTHERAGELSRQAVAELQDLRERRETRRARLASLREVLERREDLGEGTRHLLAEGEPTRRAYGLRGLVRELLEVERGAERAVEAVLAERAEALVVGEARGALAALDALRAGELGRGVFVIDPGDAPVEPGFVPLGEPLLGKVRPRDGHEGLARALLGGAYLVPSLAEALEVYGGGRIPATFATAEGDVLTPDGVVRGAATAGGSLSRLREVRDLEGEVAELEQAVARAESRQRDTEQALERASDELDNLRNRHHTAALAVANHEKDLERTRERVKALGEAREGRVAERSAFLGESESLVDEQARLRTVLEEGRAERARRQRELDALGLRIGSAGRDVTRLESTATERRVAFEGRAEQRDRLQEAAARARAAVDETRAWIERREREIEAAEVRREALAGEVAGAERALAGKLDEEERARRTSDEHREAWEREAARLREIEDSVRELRSAAGERRQQASEAELAVRESRLRLDHLDGGVREKWEVELAGWEPPVLPEEEPAAAETGGTGAAAGPAAEAAPDDDADGDEEGTSPRDALREARANAELARLPRPERQGRLEELRRKMQSLGEVNLGAIEEHEELRERFRFLSEQKEDLETTIASLREAIARINRTSRRRFRETFEAVSKRFSENFPRLFGGGRASLTLTESEDVLEAGVDIMAMPPGKRLQNVNLLSGGEKTMTAIALLVSVFQVKPAPFFLLDEVDAALDDANVGRFNQIIIDLASDSQFLIITHNKRTIEVADVLYGVTMEQKGVSKLVAVQLH